MEGNQLKILVVEDNPADFFLLKELIRGTNILIDTIDNSPSISKALIAIKENTYDLIFLDLSLPDSQGVCSFVEINNAASYTPIIVLSGMVDEKLALETVKQGAQDFLIKGNFDTSLIGKSIQYSIERKKTLDVIKQSENQYKYLFENNPMPMWAFDIETKKFLVVNQAAINHYGYSEAEFLSMTIYDIRPPSEYLILESNLKNIDRGNNIIQAKHRKKDGRQIVVEIIGHHIVVNNRNARLNLAYDITEQYKAQQDIIFHADILQNITDIVIVTDLNGIITYWNSGATKILGYSPMEISQQNITTLKSQYENIVLDDIINEVEASKAFLTHLQVVTKEGTSLWLDLKVTYMFGLNNEKTGLLWISNDITQDLLNKEKLLIQKKAIEAVGVGVIITDPHQTDNPIVMANPKFESISGYSEEEVVGRNCRFLQGEDTDPETVSEISRCIRNHETFDGEILNYRKSGEPFWNKMMINPIYDENGRLIHFVGFQQDITEAKNAKENLLYKNRELNTFIYKASHDLRSPIASLMGLVKVAQSEFSDKKVLNYLSMMGEASGRLDKILRTLMDMISFKQAEPNYETIKFASLVRDVLASDNFCDLNYINITLDFDKEAEIKTDSEILKIILKNLVENSLKFRDEHKKECHLKITLIQSPHKNQIIVSDNGLGIPKEYQNKVFDMFYRANETFPGSGLGLYIVKNFVEKLQGRLSLQTEYCIGTSIMIELPVNVLVNE